MYDLNNNTISTIIPIEISMQGIVKAITVKEESNGSPQIQISVST
jgi:hypothetical protein